MDYSEHIAKAKLKAKGDDLKDSTLFESDRGEHIGKVVEVYYNVHRGMLSVRDAKTKKVFAHTILVALEDVTFTVQPGYGVGLYPPGQRRDIQMGMTGL